jgi:hypothetical protein
MHAEVRGEDPDDFFVNYSKHYDLSSADEIWRDLTEGAQYGILNHGLYKYQVSEYLRKRSAPTDIKEQVMNEINELGMPRDASQIGAIKDIVDRARLAIIAQPELLSSDAREGLMASLDDVDEMGIDINDEEE